MIRTMMKTNSLKRAEHWKETKLPIILKNLKSVNPKAYNVLKDSQINYEKVESQYLFGACRTGKTIYSLQKALTWAMSQYVNRSINSEFIFITVPELLVDFRGCMKSDMKEQTLLHCYKNIPLLILDDFGVEKSTEWSYQLLYMLIAYRNDHNKTTIFTSNLSLLQISERLEDDRLTARILQMCKNNVLEFTNTPYI